MLNYFFRTLSIVLLICLCFFSCSAKKNAVKIKQAEAYRNLGEAYMKEGLYTAALKELLKSEKLNADDAFLQDDLGRTYFALEKLDLAVKHFQNAITIKPEYAPAINNLGATYLAQENWDAAINAFNELSKNLLYATPHYPLSNLGFAYYNKKMYDQAEANYKKALELEPKFIIALNGLGMTYMKMGKTEKALQLFEKAISIAPNIGKIHSELAKAYISQKEFKKAKYQLQKVIDLEAPGSPLSEEANEILKKLEQVEKG